MRLKLAFPCARKAGEIRHGKIARESQQNMHMLDHAVDGDWCAFKVFGDAAEEGVEAVFNLGRDPGCAMLRGVHGVVVVLCP